jgi:hypothetical protein
VEALAESESSFKNPRVSIGAAKLSVLHEFHEGEYAEFWADGVIRIFDRNGNLVTTLNSPDTLPTLQPGKNQVVLDSDGPGTVKFTTISLGEPLRP